MWLYRTQKENVVFMMQQYVFTLFCVNVDISVVSLLVAHTLANLIIYCCALM